MAEASGDLCDSHTKASSILQNQRLTNNEPIPIRTKAQREVVKLVTTNRILQIISIGRWMLHDLGSRSKALRGGSTYKGFVYRALCVEPSYAESLYAESLCSAFGKKF